jgi:hypothetical protein
MCYGVAARHVRIGSGDHPHAPERLLLALRRRDAMEGVPRYAWLIVVAWLGLIVAMTMSSGREAATAASEGPPGIAESSVARN